MPCIAPPSYVGQRVEAPTGLVRALCSHRGASAAKLSPPLARQKRSRPRLTRLDRSYLPASHCLRYTSRCLDRHNPTLNKPEPSSKSVPGSGIT